MGFDIDKYLAKAWACKVIDKDAIKVVTLKVQELLVKEPNVLRLDGPIAVVGDIHGQFHDLLELFRITGRPPGTSFLFLGDYVDRGKHSVETITLLCLLKLKYPKRIFMIRGNHETRTTNMQYGFSVECNEKFGSPDVWQYFNKLFDFLPMAATVANKIFCVHGGLSPQVETLADIDSINRFQDMPPEGAFVDLMWSDPGEEGFKGFVASTRNAGYVFGKDMVDRFLLANGLEKIVRAHQICQKGYATCFDDKFITVWSAPNYCYRFKNKASALEIDEHCELSFNIFSWSKENEEFRVGLQMEEQQNLANIFFR